MNKISAIALIPARSGSLRVPNKNIRPLLGHPLIAYSIAAATQSGLFNRIIVSTDSEKTAEISRFYGAETPFLRPSEFATAVSPDIEWIKHTVSSLDQQFDIFSIIRPTSPFRQPETIQRAWKKFINTPGADSLRAVELCKQHPGKMWIIEGSFIRPLLDQSHLEVAWHAGQYQALPKVYVQNSALEIAWVRVVREYNSREGKMVIPFFTEEYEGLSIDYEEDWEKIERLVIQGKAKLPQVDLGPYHS